MSTQRFTISEAAKVTGISPHTLRKRIKASKIKAEKVDGCWLLDISELVNQAAPETVNPLAQEVSHEGSPLVNRELFQNMAVAIQRMAEQAQDNRLALVRYQESEGHLRSRLEQLVQETASQAAENAIQRREMEQAAADLRQARRARAAWMLAALLLAALILAAGAGYVSMMF